MLTLEQIEFYEREGYLVVEDVLSQDRVIKPILAEYEALLDELYAEWYEAGRVVEAPDELDFYGKLLAAYRADCDWFQPMDISLPGDEIKADTPMHTGPAVFDLLKCDKLLDVVECIVGSEIVSNPIQHVRIKPPADTLNEVELRAHITSTDWHQDRGVAHAEADETAMVTVWCAISDATVENGCLQVVPAAHRSDLLPHCPYRQTSVAEGFVDEKKAIPLPVKSGGVVLFHPLAPHASLANNTDGFRWSFDIRYNRVGEPTGRAHFPEFIARSRANPDSVLQDWRVWQSMWEDTRTKLATAPHIKIHRWESDAPFCA